MEGAELSADKDNVPIKGLQLFGSVTYVDSRILSDPTWAGTNPLTGLPDTVVGNRVPYVPDWRAKLGFTYRPDEYWAWTVAGRYSGKQYSTLDNTDIISHVYGAFDDYLRGRHKLHYEATENFSVDFGIDNRLQRAIFPVSPVSGPNLCDRREISVLKPIRERRPVMRTPIVAALLLMVLGVHSAYAHAHLDHATPAVGSTVSTAPTEVSLFFAQNLEPAFSSVPPCA